MERSFVRLYRRQGVWALIIAVIACGSWVHSELPKTHAARLGPHVAQAIGGTGGGSIPVLVTLKEQAILDEADGLATRAEKGAYVVKQLREVALRTQAPLIEFLISRGVKFQRFYITNALAIESATPELLRELAELESVSSILADDPFKTALPVFKKSEPDPVVMAGPESNLESMGATKVWNELGVRGKGITVAGADTGIEWDHPGLIKQYRGSMGLESPSHVGNWHDSIHPPSGGGGRNKCGYNTHAPCDDDQHGTHTIGTVVGYDGGDNATGVAPEAQWIGCRNMDAGAGTPSRYIECYEWFIAPYALGADPLLEGDSSLAPHVINNSWGCDASEGCKGEELRTVLKAIRAAGIFNVVAAGNSGPGCASIDSQPATLTDLTFSVGALDHRKGLIAGFSSRGPSNLDGGVGPDVSAPGVSIRSSIPGKRWAGGFMWSGTSMAGPHVAGAVALLWSAHPELVGKIAETESILRNSATPKASTQSCGGVVGSATPNNTFGYGSLDVYKAVQMAAGM